ncbi:hypothetical protein MLD52_07940 [Puniceicoccaceae bacterium K14]|nr:hypothetical protein [Puniceicoccaceae bacterium K14]
MNNDKIEKGLAMMAAPSIPSKSTANPTDDSLKALQVTIDDLEASGVGLIFIFKAMIQLTHEMSKKNFVDTSP